MANRFKVAIVTGVNGISGNAIVEHLIRTPKTEWSKIIITSRRPLKNYWQDPRVEFIALDFLEPVETIISKMTPYCSDVTHAYFTSYVHTDDFAKLKEFNVPLSENFLTAIDQVARNTLQRVCLQTGGKHYGVHLGPVKQPCSEEHPRYDDKGENFYYSQEDFLFAMQKNRNWTYNIIRPNAIIGFTPGNNGMSEALTLALYFLICRETGEFPRFPGNQYFYNCVDDNSYAPSLAEMSVWATTNPEAANEAFNHANGDTFVWRYFFPRIGAYFGLEVPETTVFTTAATLCGPGTSRENQFKMSDWAADKRPVWESICAKYGGSPEAFDWGTWAFFDWGIGKAWPTLSSISKARRFGWNRYDDTFESWVETFRAFENAGVLPRVRVLRGEV
ncbi:SDR family oxidoreductase [Aspergillus foveolatus]|uniref:SDR family oxidoreductase n=1 Tax=Aspergillus foveolatus TaxID=210207 RepID=UPI003CCE5010